MIPPLYSAGQEAEDRIVFNKLTISEQVFWPIRTIFQDHKGMMWFSGKNHLAYFDGNRIDTISIRDDKGDVYITGMLESRNNELVISSSNGLYFIDPGSEGIVSSEPVLDGCINVMIPQDQDHLWLGTNQGLFQYSISNGLIKKLTMEHGLPSDVVNGLITGKDSTLWITTWHGMAILPADAELPAKIEHDKDRFLYGQMAEDAEGNIWAGGESEITIFDYDLRPIRTVPSEINSKILPPTFIPWQILLSDSRGWIWHAVPEK